MIWDWWQKLPLGFDGVFLSIGSFEIQYYGLMYMVAFGICYWLLNKRVTSKEDESGLDKKQLDDLFFGLILSVLVGGRLGYVLFYNLEYYLSTPLEVIWPFKAGEFVGISGMSFHGGLLACIAFGYYFIRKHKLEFWNVSDLIVSVAPLGYFFGRLGNFLNNELYGRQTESFLGMYFQDFPAELRYPSQLFQGVFEGVGLFVLLWFFRKKGIAKGYFLGISLVWFGSMRFILEFFREPDAHLGLLLGLSRGQYLSGIMLALGIAICWFRSRGKSD